MRGCSRSANCRMARHARLLRAADAERGVFIRAAQPVLIDLMREAGAGVILERRSVLFSANAIDITDIAIQRLDDAIGDGADLAKDR